MCLAAIEKGNERLWQTEVIIASRLEQINRHSIFSCLNLAVHSRSLSPKRTPYFFLLTIEGRFRLNLDGHIAAVGPKNAYLVTRCILSALNELYFDNSTTRTFSVTYFWGQCWKVILANPLTFALNIVVF